MATDAAVSRTADASASDPALTSLQTPETELRNAGPDRSSLNGSPPSHEPHNKRIAGVEGQTNSVTNSANVSISGGSDTEASKGDSTNDKSKAHLRSASNAAKKPATFKAVSVNKTFLSKGPTNPTAKPAEKLSGNSSLSTTPTAGGGSSALSSSRPRLVAKSGSGAGSSPKFPSANGGKPSTGPGSNAVWNKNQPAPPPEPKTFTDEELKKYGIHMASRLNPEATQTSTWADIEDDDDDWAPDTITWTDGTKVTLPHPDENAAAAAATDNEPPSTLSQNIPTAKANAPDKPGPSHGDVSAPAPRAGGSTLPSGRGLVLKGGSAEKSGAAPKPAPSTSPAKSPWAKLPPVEKAPPIAQEHPQAGHYFHGHAGGLPPPREIAADDFNRSTWREGPAGGNRELYNSQSGRYEPVADRRGSMRADQQSRPHNFQQRPSHSDHPEPSAAFQTSRSGQEGGFGRRRGSSNVSASNVPYLQRPGYAPHDGHLEPRRGSLTMSADSPSSPRHASLADPASQQRNQPSQSWHSHVSPSMSHATPHQAHAQPAAAESKAPQEPQVAEEIELQKKIMHEKRELAFQRRREQEAREEAEKQKRIKAKLDAMGPAPERKSAKKDIQASVQIQQRRPSTAAESPSSKDESSAHAHDVAAVPPVTSPSTAQPAAIGDQRTSGRSIDQSAGAGKETIPLHLRDHHQQHQGHSSSANPMGMDTLPPTNMGPPQIHGRQEPSSQSQSWAGATPPQPDRFAGSWGPSAPQPPSNVWAPNNARGLGNGTFNASLGRAPASPPLGRDVPKGPAPIAPPSAQRAPGSSFNQDRLPESTRPHNDLMKSRWSSAVMESDRRIIEETKTQAADRDRYLAERGLNFADNIADIQDSWRPHKQADSHKTTAPDASSQRSKPAIMRQDPSHVANPAAALGAPSAAAMLPSKSASSQTRSSRFFPSKDARSEPAVPSERRRNRSPSPPPPDTVGHPAFDGDVHHPHVSLPRPQPVVRLPPAANAANASRHDNRNEQLSWAQPHSHRESDSGRGQASHTRTPLTEHYGGNLRPRAQGNAWNEKIQNLFSDRKTSAGRNVSSPPSSADVESSSKSSLEHSSRNNQALVSLPQKRRASVDMAVTRALASVQKLFKDDATKYSVKPVSEECFAAQEMGSLPQIRMPRDAPEAAWHPASPPSPQPGDPRRFVNADITSSPQHWVPHDMSESGTPEYRIHLPGMVARKSVLAPSSRARSNPRRGSGRGGARGSHGGRGGRNREANSQSGESTQTSNSTRPGRGGYRGRGSDWSRRPSHQVAQS